MRFNAMKERPIILILLLATLIYALSLTSRLTLGGDGAQYVMLAEALIEGKGYTDFYGPVDIPHSICPFGFSLMLAPLVGIFGRNLLILKLVPLFSTVLALYILFLLLREYTEGWVISAIMLLTALSPLILSYSTILVSEAPYLLFSFMTLLFLVKYKSQKSTLNKYLFLSVVAMLLSYYTRFVGISLFACALLFLGFKRDMKKSLAISVLFVPLLLPWIYRSHLVGGYGWVARYLSKDVFSPDLGMMNLLDFIKRFFYNIVIYAGKVFPDTFFYPHLLSITRGQPIFILKLIIGGFISILSLYGFIIHIRKRINAIDLYIIPYFGICLAYPWHGTKFTYPVLPFLFYYFILGAKSLIERFNLLFSKKLNSKKIPIFFLFIIILSSLCGDAVLIFKAHREPYFQDEYSYIQANEWIKKNTPSESRIVCRKPRFTYFYTKRKAMYYPYSTDASRLIKLIEENEIDYVIVDVIVLGISGAERYLKPAIAKYPDYFALVYSTSEPETKIYKVLGQ